MHKHTTAPTPRRTTFDDFFDGFLTCAMWLAHDDDGPGEYLEDTYTAQDIDLATLAQLRDECRTFWDQNFDDICAHGLPAYSGHDFLLTRNGHGCGFWSRDTGEVGDRLTTAAKMYKEVDLYVGDNGLIYCA